MSVIWLIVWLCCNSPHVSFARGNGWAVALGVCLAVDLMGALSRS